MGRYRFNPFTGTLDDVGTGGGGGAGTVTSVGGGEGITATPEPIVGAGVVDLDLFSLATGADPLAAGDWLAFVDVSVGTGPSAQRKVTFADLATDLAAEINPLLDHGLLTGLSPDDDHDQYVRRVGRGPTLNDFVICDGADDGRITGSTAAANLELRASVTFSYNTFVDSIPTIRAGTGLVGPTPGDFAFFSAGAGLTFDIDTNADGYTIDNRTVANFIGDVRSIREVSARRFFTNDDGLTSNIGEYRGALLQPTYTPGAGSTMTSLNSRGVVLAPTFDNTGVSNTVASIIGIATGGAASSVGASWSILNDWAIGTISNPGGTGAIARLGGIRVQDITRGTINYSVWSEGFGVQMRHAGPVVIGDGAFTTAPVATLDVYGDVAILPSPGAGRLFFYEPSAAGAHSTAIEAQAQAADIAWILPAAQGGASTSLTNDGAGVLSWVAHQPLDADLTALAALSSTAGMLARTGAGTFAVRTIASTSSALVVTNGDGAAGAPSFALDADLNTIGGLTVAVGSLLLGVAGPAWGLLGIGAADRYLKSDGTTAAWAQVTELGLVDTYNGVTTVARGMPSVVSETTTTGLTNNVALNEFFNIATTGWYRASAYLQITTAAGVSSTLPQFNLVWVDGASGVGQSAALTATTTANTTGTSRQGDALVYAQAGTFSLGYSTSGYASNAANAMTYTVRIVVEAL